MSHLKKKPTNEPECSHVKHFCETSHFNSLTVCIIPLLWYQSRLWSMERGGVQSVECENSGVLRGKCSV